MVDETGRQRKTYEQWIKELANVRFYDKYQKVIIKLRKSEGNFRKENLF